MSVYLVKVGRAKIQQIGGALYILLPILWRKDRGLKQGDVLEMFSDGGPELIIKPASDGGGK